MALIFCWIQIGLKGFLIFYLFLDFKSKNSSEVNYLFNFNYQAQSNQQSTKSTAHEDDFGRNPYDN